MFRRGTEVIRQDALYVYRLMLIEFKDHPGEPLLFSPKTMAVFLDATFYGAPKLEKTHWKWNGHAFGDDGVHASILYKPHALQAWLLLWQETGAQVKLVVDTASSDTIETDIYGFTNRPLPLHFQTSGNQGVICAVLSNEDPTEVHDRSLALPIAILA